MSQLKKLHVCQSIDGLNKMSIIPNAHNKGILKLLNTLKVLMQEAERYEREGDEELAYVFYMRYFNLFHFIHRSPEYEREKKTVIHVIGGNDTVKCRMKKLEELSNSLARRYDMQSVSKGNNNISSTSMSNGVGNTDTALLAVSPSRHLSTDFKNMSKLISAESLFERIQACNVLILDCRSSQDYNMSCLTYEWTCNVPEEYIKPGMSAGKLQAKLNSEAKTLWAARISKDHVVLMDWSCQVAAPKFDTAIGILLDILENWDPDVVYRSPIRILENGYEYFKMLYPTYCTNPGVKAPQKSSNASDLNDIEYPSIDSIAMKSEIRSKGKPTIDRASKMAALKSYEEKQKQFTEIQVEHEQISERAKENDEQMLEAKQKWNSINDETERLELYHKMLQLESQAEDYKLENESLREQLELFKREKEQQTQANALTQNDLKRIDAVREKIEQTIETQQKQHEQLEREREERERQLSIARETKPQHVSAKLHTRNEAKMCVPEIDRSRKPQTAVVVARERDFSPVAGGKGQGLTGLRNLGNTCYMNSILQCLSNTPTLTEFCRTNQYVKHINRNSKTRGEIVEEYAELMKWLWRGKYRSVACKDLRYVLGQHHEMFATNDQQDSHEFLTIIIDLLHADLRTLPTTLSPRSNISAADKAWLEFSKARESIILNLFYGQLKSTVKCANCDKESYTYESFSNLSLELPESNAIINLETCLELYFGGEIINGFQCDSCKKSCNAVKKLDICKLPPILIIHLKRFIFDAAQSSYKKNQSFVRFPLEHFNAQPFVAPSEARSTTPKKYQLYGVSNHYGSMNTGHYTAYCKNQQYERWFKFDDQIASTMESSAVVSRAAYILFYTWTPNMQHNGKA